MLGLDMDSWPLIVYNRVYEYGVDGQPLSKESSHDITSRCSEVYAKKEPQPLRRDVAGEGKTLFAGKVAAAASAPTEIQPKVLPGYGCEHRKLYQLSLGASSGYFRLS